MPKLRTEEMPAEIAELRDQVAEFTGTPVMYEHLVVADHTWEGLRPGAYSIVLEGQYGWATRFANAVDDGKVRAPEGWEVYRGTGYRLDIYPADPPAVPEDVSDEDFQLNYYDEEAAARGECPGWCCA